MSKIKSVRGLEVIDSRGTPTVRAEVLTDDGHAGAAMVPSGASTGEREAFELRDGDQSRYFGKGVLQAVKNIEGPISDCLVGVDVHNQNFIDQRLCELDASPNKQNLGSNAVLAVSLAVAKAAASVSNLPLFRSLATVKDFVLPVPMMNILNGGSHANNNVDFQEFMIVPFGAPSFGEAVRYGVEVFHTLKKILDSKGMSTTVGDEGGFAPNLSSNEEAVQLILTAIEDSGYIPGEDIGVSLDVASSEFFKEGFYFFAAEGRKYDSFEMIRILQDWVEKYPIISIEDGMDQNDWDGWKVLTSEIGESTQLVGDDLFVTNVEFLKKGIEQHIANAILIKVNQIGSLSETVAAIKVAQKSNFATIVSHRSGETEDVTIADMACAFNAKQIKIGSLSRSDRTSKYNRLLVIEKMLGDQAIYAGRSAFSNIRF